MDQQLDESLSLVDGAIGIEFNGEQEVVTTSDCSFDTTNPNFGSEIDEEMELGQIRDDHDMDPENQIIGDSMEYVTEVGTVDMPTLGGEEEVMAEEPKVQTTIISEEIMQVSNPNNLDKEAITPELITQKFSKITTIPTTQTFFQTFRVASNPTLKPVSIAPKPITMTTSGFANVKKISLAPGSSSILGSELSGRQVVVVPGTGSRLKVVGGVPSPQLLQLRQRPAPPLAKLSLTPSLTAPGAVAVQKSTPARYISIQQAQQMGLLSGGKFTQLVAMSPTKQQATTSTPVVRSVRQNLQCSVKSPAKILPAPLQGVGNTGKMILTAAPSVVIRPAVANKPPQVLKMEGQVGSTGTLLASIPAGQKINPQQIHQINIPGKGVQYVRLLPASGLTQAKSTSAAASPAPASAPATATVLASPTKLPTKLPTTQQILPKTFLITDFQSNLVQVVPNKAQSIITTSSAGTATKKLVTKAPAKLVPVSMNVTPTVHKLAEATTPVTFTLSTTLSTKVQSAPAPSLPQVQKIEIEIEEAPQECVPQSENIKEEMSTGNDMMDQDIVEEEMEEGSPEESPPMSPPSPIETKHIVMLPPTYLQQIQQQPVQQHNMTKTMQISTNVDVKEEISEYNAKFESALEFGLRPRKPCNCTKSQCLKLYCDCFANGEFCNQCNCNNCFNNLENEEYRQKAIRSCLDRNPNAFRPKIGKAKNNLGPDVIRRHNKGCNCKRSGCLKNYCECYEGKIACSANCKCVGCRNIEDSLDKKTLRRARAESVMGIGSDTIAQPFNNHASSRVHSTHSPLTPKSSQSFHKKQPCSIMTSDVIEAVCQCLLAQAADAESSGAGGTARQVLEEFAHCLQDIIGAAQHTSPAPATGHAPGPKVL